MPNPETIGNSDDSQYARRRRVPKLRWNGNIAAQKESNDAYVAIFGSKFPPKKQKAAQNPRPKPRPTCIKLDIEPPFDWPGYNPEY